MRLQRDEIIHRDLQAFQQAHPVPTAAVSHRVGQLLQRIHDDLFDTSLCVKTLKGRCRIADNNVSCRFKYEMGMSIRDYVESMRLDAAQHLLETGLYTAFEVGQALGYCNAQTFYRAFARHFHCTPGRMRKSGQVAECSSIPSADVERPSGIVE